MKRIFDFKGRRFLYFATGYYIKQKYDYEKDIISSFVDGLGRYGNGPGSG
jgi:hypothetical protein